MMFQRCFRKQLRAARFQTVPPLKMKGQLGRGEVGSVPYSIMEGADQIWERDPQTVQLYLTSPPFHPAVNFYA